MTGQRSDRQLASFFESVAGEVEPEGLLDDVFRVTRRSPQRRGRLARVMADIGPRLAPPINSLSFTRIGMVVLLALLALATVVALVGSRPRIPSPLGRAGNGVIAFDLDGAIHVVAANGTTRVLDVGLGRSWGAVFSRDGTQLAFWSQERPRSNVSLFVARADGSRARKVSGDMAVFMDPLGVPSWSPDGTWLAFSSSDRGLPERLYVAAADGSGVRPLTGPDADRTNPAWSPDGSWIAYRAGPSGSDGQARLTVIRPDGSDERALMRAESRNSTFAAPQWSGDGRSISAFHWDGDRGVAAIVDLAGATRILSLPTESAGEPALSSDGSTAAFVIEGEGGVILDLVTRGRVTLPLGPGDCGMVWSPDDTALLGLGPNGACDTVSRIPVADPGSATLLTERAGEIRIFGWQRVAP